MRMPTRARATPRHPGHAIVMLVLASSLGCAHAINPVVIQDAQLAARVKTAIVNDPELGPRAIEVRVTGGVVHLSGRVLSADEAQRLVALVRSVAGVRDVQSGLRVGPAPPAGVTRRPAAGQGEAMEPPGDPRLLAVGGSVTWVSPREAALDGGATLGPLVRLGAGSGLALSIDFNWFRATLRDEAHPAPLGRVRVRPVMAGAGYTMRTDRASVAVSLVGGLAFNSLSHGNVVVADDLVALEIDNSLVWRPGVSIWVDPSRRWAVNLFAGYLVTRPSIRFLEDGRVTKRELRADTILISTGLAYKLF